MKTIKIGKEEYTLEFTFEAAENKDLVQSMFNLISGAYILKKTDGDIEDATTAFKAYIDGTSEMVSSIPGVVRTAFYAGLLEHHGATSDEAKELMRQYMTETKMSYKAMFDVLKEVMEEDGFFNLSGLNDMIKEMNQATQTEEQPKKPQDHKPKQTSKKS